MSFDTPELPDFLRVPKDYRPERPTKRLRWTNQMTFTTKKKDEDPATRKLRREIEKAEQEKKQAKLRYLRENY